MTLSDARKGYEESNEELGALIQFWKDSLAQHRLLMSPSAIYLVEMTIKCLGVLKHIKEGNR